jgi:hypothetical protein
MTTSLLKALFFVIVFSACSRSMSPTQQSVDPPSREKMNADQPDLPTDQKPLSLMELPQTQHGGFVLRPGFYEAEFKTYCLQPGTPDPSQGDAYLQSNLTGYRKEIVESVLTNSSNRPEIDQKNIQLLLWSAVSGSDFNKLSYAVKDDARKLLTPKQVFELQGGVVGLIKTISYQSGLLNANSEIKKLFDVGTSSYESFERLAVSREPSKITRSGVKYDTWYKQEEDYYVRYFPLNYQKVRIQVFVPEGLVDSEGKVRDEYLVFDPTGKQAIPAFTNAQRLGIGAPFLNVVRTIIEVKKASEVEKKSTEKRNPSTSSPKTTIPRTT